MGETEKKKNPSVLSVLNCSFVIEIDWWLDKKSGPTKWNGRRVLFSHFPEKKSQGDWNITQQSAEPDWSSIIGAGRDPDAVGVMEGLADSSIITLHNTTNTMRNSSMITQPN